MSHSSRRDFLKTSGLCIMAGGAGFVGTEQFLRGAQLASGVDAAPENDPDRQKPTLVTIFLRGGADALNAIIPVGDPKYYEVRPGIAIPAKPKAGEDAAALPYPKQKGMWGLHPSMKALVPLIEAGQLIPIVNVGSPHGTRSHFSAQDYMERAALGDARYTQGWLNRYLELSKKPYDQPLRGLSAMSLLPRALRGDYPVLAGNNRAQDMDLFEHLYAPQNMVNMTAREQGKAESGSSLADRPVLKKETARQGLTSDQTRDIITESGSNAVLRLKALQKAGMQPIEATYPGGQLGSQLSTIARVIKANCGLEVAQADYDGWDHHSGMGGLRGAHANMLTYLSACLSAFHQDLGKRMDKVIVLVMSEFGRTVHENGSNGTDHGRAGFMLAMGGAPLLTGGKIYGDWKGMDELEQARFQPVHTDFRTVFAETLVKLFRFDPYKSKMFPNYQGAPKDFVGFMNQMKEA
jgi:uncharacterized protein (DUF1501 family)